jgi:hypothetical protein
MRARMITHSWDGLRTKTIAEEPGCHAQPTVRERFHRFNAQGIDGLGDLSCAGRKPRITVLRGRASSVSEAYLAKGAI